MLGVLRDWFIGFSVIIITLVVGFTGLAFIIRFVKTLSPAVQANIAPALILIGVLAIPSIIVGEIVRTKIQKRFS